MTDKPLTKKKVYQVAKEINISHETLIDYLTKRGHTVKSHMSILDDAMMHDILSHFKKDKEVAEKHQRKIQTLRESRVKRSEIKQPPEEESSVKQKALRKPKVEEEAPAPAEIVAQDEKKPVEPAETAQVAAAEEALSAQLPAGPGVETETAAEADTAPAPSEEAARPPASKRKEPELLQRRTPKMGLKIKGKIDLEEVNRTNALLESGGVEGGGKQSEGEKEEKEKTH
jgi:translation initiation factor IF-2